MLNSLKQLIEELDKNYSTISINEDDEYFGYVTIKYSNEDLELLTIEELAEFDILLQKGFYSPCVIDVNKYYLERLEVTRLNENRYIEFKEIEFRLKGVA